ncbi:MAG: glycosyltransferase family 2 protein [Alphaproteobacteria bacterium]
MKVAVVTPYFREAGGILRACHASVAGQTHPCTHFMIADGHPAAEVEAWPIQHFVLARSHDDNGNTPRCIGALSAMNQGFEAIAFLDADNWYEADHIAGLVALHQQTGAAICTAGRSLRRLDGTVLVAHDDWSDGDRMADTNCVLLTREAFRLLPVWALMPKQLSPVCDRVFWTAVRRSNLSRAHLDRPSVAFRTQYAQHYRQRGEAAPDNAKEAEATDHAIRWWNALPADSRSRWDRLLYGA